MSILLLSRSGFHFIKLSDWKKDKKNNKSRAYFQNCITNRFTSTASWNFARWSHKRWQMSLIHIFGDRYTFWLSRSVLVDVGFKSRGVTNRTWRSHKKSPSLRIWNNRCTTVGGQRLWTRSTTAPLPESLNWSSIGKQRILEGIMKSCLTAESFGQEVRLWDISLLSYKHSNRPSYSGRIDDHFIMQIHDIEYLPV